MVFHLESLILLESGRFLLRSLDWRKLFYPAAECAPIYAIFTFQLWIRGSSGIVQIYNLLLKFRSILFLIFCHLLNSFSLIIGCSTFSVHTYILTPVPISSCAHHRIYLRVAWLFPDNNSCSLRGQTSPGKPAVSAYLSGQRPSLPFICSSRTPCRCRRFF